MKTTLDIDDNVMQKLRKEAVCRDTMAPVLVEAGLRHVLEECNESPPQDKDPLPPLPKWRGRLLVDISNRDELYRIFDEDAGFRTNVLIYSVNEDSEFYLPCRNFSDFLRFPFLTVVDPVH